MCTAKYSILKRINILLLYGNWRYALWIFNKIKVLFNLQFRIAFSWKLYFQHFLNTTILKRIKKMFKWYTIWPLLRFKIFEEIVKSSRGLAQNWWIYKYCPSWKQNWSNSAFFEKLTRFYNNPYGILCVHTLTYMHIYTQNLHASTYTHTQYICRIRKIFMYVWVSKECWNEVCKMET